MSEKDFSFLIRMCHKLIEKDFGHQTNNSNEILMLFGYRQFVFQELNLNLLSRNHYIYSKLWYETKEAKDLDVLEEIKKIIGVEYKAVIIFAYALLGNQDGYFWPYNEEQLSLIKEKFKLNVKPKDHLSFIKWCSGDYEKIVNETKLENPFILYPIIETKTKPRDDLGEVYLMASHQLLHNKITYGLYYILIDKFNMGSSKNIFKEKFGYVFQKYIGVLLDYYFSTWKIIPEIKYKISKHNLQDSADWFLLKNDKLILFEVKQSSIFIKAKESAKVADIKKDLRKTLVKAVSQLNKSEKDIKSGKYRELDKFSRVKYFIKMVVVNDPMYFGNTVIKDLIKEELDEANKQSNFHIINVNDFEVLLDSQKETESLFDILNYKEIEFPKMDFKEFIIKMYPSGSGKVKFLDDYYENCFM